MDDIMQEQANEKFNNEVYAAKEVFHAVFEALLKDETAEMLSGVMAISLAAVEIAYSVGLSAKLSPAKVTDMVAAMGEDMMTHLAFLLEQQASNSDPRLMQEVAHA